MIRPTGLRYVYVYVYMDVCSVTDSIFLAVYDIDQAGCTVGCGELGGVIAPATLPTRPDGHRLLSLTPDPCSDLNSSCTIRFTDSWSQLAQVRNALKSVVLNTTNTPKMPIGVI